MKSKKKNKNISFFKILFIFIIFGGLISVLGYNCYNNFHDIYLLNNKKNQLNDELALLLEKEESLESDIKRLEDPDYIAKYVREKYLYSKDGELILRMDDEEKE